MPWPYPPRSKTTSQVDFVGFCRADICAKSLKQQSSLLFEQEDSDEDLELSAYEIRPNPSAHAVVSVIKGERNQEAYFQGLGEDIKRRNQSTKKLEPVVRIICLFAPHSLGRFGITQSGIEQFLNTIDAPVEFWEPFTAFGYREKYKDAGFGCFWSTINGLDPIAVEVTNISNLDLACTYMLRHPELHGRENQFIPWSIRQMAVIQQRSSQSYTETSMILQASQRFEECLDKLADDWKDGNGILQYGEHWTTLHALALTALKDQWKDFTNYWEAKVATMTVETLFPQLHPSDATMEDDAIQLRLFQKLQESQSIIDWLLRIQQALRLNICTLEKLSTFADRAFKNQQLTSKDEDTKYYQKFMLRIETCLNEQRFTLDNIRCLLERASHAISTFRDISREREGYAMKTLARHTKQAAKDGTTLTEQTIHEARMMRIITLMALVFLPSTFIASFLDMGYVSISRTSNGSLDVAIETNMLLFLILALPLTLVVVGGFFVWENWVTLGRLFYVFRHKNIIPQVEKGSNYSEFNMA